MFKLVAKKHFKNEIRGLDYDPINKLLIVGLTETHYAKSENGSIWEFL